MLHFPWNILKIWIKNANLCEKKTNFGWKAKQNWFWEMRTLINSKNSISRMIQMLSNFAYSIVQSTSLSQCICHVFICHDDDMHENYNEWDNMHCECDYRGSVNSFNHPPENQFCIPYCLCVCLSLSMPFINKRKHEPVLTKLHLPKRFDWMQNDTVGVHRKLWISQCV